MDAATIVKRIRSKNGITRKELAELADLSPSTVGRIERGEIDPTWGTLSRLLAATGHQINGNTVVSAGDASAVAAAQPLLSALMTALEPSMRALRTSIVASAQDAAVVAAQDITRFDWSKVWKSVLKSTPAPEIPLPSATSEWRSRWKRAGWLDEGTDANDFVTLAISAGNAAKISRRDTTQRAVNAPEGWQTLARRLGEAKEDYAVSGLVAARRDRAVAEANMPVFYVEDPVDLADRYDLSPAAPGQGVLLLEAGNGELDQIENEAGIRFVPRSLALLDALAGSGREPDKAENELRKLLAA